MISGQSSRDRIFKTSYPVLRASSVHLDGLRRTQVASNYRLALTPRAACLGLDRIVQRPKKKKRPSRRWVNGSKTGPSPWRNSFCRCLMAITHLHCLHSQMLIDGPLQRSPLLSKCVNYLARAYHKTYSRSCICICRAVKRE